MNQTPNRLITSMNIQKALLPIAMLAGLTLSSCVVAPIRPVVGVGVGYYSVVPTTYVGDTYWYGDRYYYGGVYSTGRFLYRGHYYDHRYYHGGHYFYGGRFEHHEHRGDHFRDERHRR